MGPMIIVGTTKAQGSKAKPVELGQSRPERWTKQQKEWLAAGASGAPSRGLNILNLHILVLTGRFPSHPFMWDGIEPSWFSYRIT
jgi:hypothetical protein